MWCFADISAINRENKAWYSSIIVCITFAQHCIKYLYCQLHYPRSWDRLTVDQQVQIVLQTSHSDWSINSMKDWSLQISIHSSVLWSTKKSSESELLIGTPTSSKIAWKILKIKTACFLCQTSTYFMTLEIDRMASTLPLACWTWWVPNSNGFGWHASFKVLCCPECQCLLSQLFSSRCLVGHWEIRIFHLILSFLVLSPLC